MSGGRRLLTCYYRPKPGGFCRRLFRCVEALAERGHEVHYLAVERFPIDHPRCHFHRLRLPLRAREGPLFWFWFLLLAPLALLRLAARVKAERLFAFGTPYALILQPARWWRRCRLAVFLRGDAVSRHRFHGRWLAAAAERWVEGPALVGTHLFTVSDELGRRVAARHRRLRSASVATLTNDLPQPVAAAEAAAAERSGAGRLRLAAVGVLDRAKNLRLLVDAVARPPAAALDLTFYGEGAERAALEAAAEEAGVRERVRFAGWVAAERIWGEVDLLAMPSFDEGAPNAVLEAFAHGVPVLASDIPAHRELLPTTALLPVDDAGAWADALAAIAADPERALARLRAEQRSAADRFRFDWEERMEAAILGAGAAG